MTVIQFPRRYRHPLPEDAIPRGRDRHVLVCPLYDKWVVVEQDESGGFLTSGMTKSQVITAALETVMTYNGTKQVLNHNPDDDVSEVLA
jgi:hypothetical protein